MFETSVTVVGRLITQFQSKTFADGTLKIHARMACTERRVDRVTGEWSDGQTLFLTVICKRGLAENAHASLRSGDRLVVHGRLYSREYEMDGKPRSTLELDAWALGPDLQWCTVAVTKKSRSSTSPVSGGDAEGENAAAEPSGGRQAGGTAVSVWDSGPPDSGDEHPASADPGPSDGSWETGGSADVRVGEAAVGV